MLLLNADSAPGPRLLSTQSRPVSVFSSRTSPGLLGDRPYKPWHQALRSCVHHSTSIQVSTAPASSPSGLPGTVTIQLAVTFHPCQEETEASRHLTLDTHCHLCPSPVLAMAEHFKEACACPVCSGYLETPVRLECGYVCCQRCLNSLQKEPLGEGLLCPHCSTVSEKEDISHVSQLDRAVSKVKKLEPMLRATLYMNPRVKKFQVDVTLDVDTAHSHLVISEDLRSVRCGRSAQRQGARAESFDSALCVLGSPLPASGRSYWEVEVGTSREWDVGACADTASRRGPLLLSTERSFWTVGLRLGEVFAACTVPMTELQLLPRLRRLGILLDADLRLLSFCDVADGAHIFTFTHVSACPLRPFFAPASTLHDDPGVLRICPVGPIAQDSPGKPSHHPPSDSSCQPSLEPLSQTSPHPPFGSLRGPPRQLSSQPTRSPLCGPLHRSSSQPPRDLPGPSRQPSQEPPPEPSPQPSRQPPHGPPGRPPRRPPRQPVRAAKPRAREP